MANLTDAEFEAAEARGRKMLETEPRAASARYDRKTGRVIIVSAIFGSPMNRARRRQVVSTSNVVDTMRWMM